MRGSFDFVLSIHLHFVYMNHFIAFAKFFLFLFLVVISTSISAQQKHIQLYNGAAPGSESWTWNEQETVNNILNSRIVYNVTHPTLTVYLPTTAANGTAIIICPGGSYHVLIMEPAVPELVKELNRKGVIVFVLSYRLLHSITDDPWQEMMLSMNDSKKFALEIAPVIKMAEEDTKTAIAYVRQHASELNIDVNRVGILGFSAGGGLAASLAYNFTPETRPDFVAPIYALTEGIARRSVQQNAPPMFIAAATDDQIVPVSSSVNLYNDWSDSKHSAEIHIYSKGNHGLISFPANTWMIRFEEWLDLQGFTAFKK
jgi:acetyl esterase/lipase